MSPPGAKTPAPMDLGAGADDRGGDRDQGDIYQSSGRAASTARLGLSVKPLTLPAECEPRFETGWAIMHGDTTTGEAEQVYAFLRPYSEDWYDLIACRTWWEATALAIAIQQRTPDCEFIGELGRHYEVAE